MRASCWLALVSVMGLANLAAAQMPAEVTGTIISVEGPVIFVKEANTDAVVRCDTSRIFFDPVKNVQYAVPGAVSINVTGTEDVRNLRPGMNLQFTVTLSNKRTAIDEVQNATLFNASPNTQSGILNAEPIDPPAEPVEGDKKGKPAMLEKCLIAATITKAKNGVLTVTYPNEKRGNVNLNIRLAADAAITVSGDGLSLTRPGDKIHATGTGWIPGHFLAREIKIEHSPLPDEKAARLNKPELAEKMKPGEKKEREAFEIGDPEDKKPAAALPVKAKVKVQVLKVN